MAEAELVKQHARAQFQQWARSYDRSWLNELVFFPSMRACQAEIRRWKQSRDGRRYRLLDVGCGTGRLITLQAADVDAELLIGLDFAPAMIRRLVDRVTALNVGPRILALLGDSERIPLADATVDVVTCCNSFHHYPHQERVIAEFRRVLRPGGMLVLIDGFRDNVIGWLVFDVGVALVERRVYHAPWSAIRRMALEAGFADVTQRKMNVLAPLLVSVAAAGG